MVEQKLEPTDTKVPAFTALASSIGVTIWGYQTEATTGIAGVTSDRGLDNGAVYNLSGQCVSSLQHKGIYIRNGKKCLKP